MELADNEDEEMLHSAVIRRKNFKKFSCINKTKKPAQKKTLGDYDKIVKNRLNKTVQEKEQNHIVSEKTWNVIQNILTQGKWPINYGEKKYENNRSQNTFNAHRNTYSHPH